MNIENMKEAVEIILGRRIDDTIWIRFAGGNSWNSSIVELLARLFEDAEPSITEMLAEIDATEAEDPTLLECDGNLAASQLMEMFDELAGLKLDQIRNRLREVPGLIDSLAAYYCRPGGSFEYQIYVAEMQAWGQKAVPAPWSVRYWPESMIEKLRTRAHGARPQRQDENVGDADAKPPEVSDGLVLGAPEASANREC